LPFNAAVISAGWPWRDGVGVSARIQQVLDHRGVAVEGGKVERGDVIPRRYSGFGARSEQDIDQLQVVALRCPMERRRAVRTGGIDVHALRDQRAHRRRILMTGGVDQARFRLRGQDRCDGEVKDEGEPPDPGTSHGRPPFAQLVYHRCG